MPLREKFQDYFALLLHPFYHFRISILNKFYQENQVLRPVQYRVKYRVQKIDCNPCVKCSACLSDGSESDGSPGPAADAPKLTFDRSSKTLKWDGAFNNLLDCILENDIQIDSGCRAGSCGTCVVAIKSGRVTCTSESHTRNHAQQRKNIHDYES